MKFTWSWLRMTVPLKAGTPYPGALSFPREWLLAVAGATGDCPQGERSAVSGLLMCNRHFRNEARKNKELLEK